MQQQQRLAHILEIVQDLIALFILLAAELITFILDLVCLASRRGYLKLKNLFDEYKFCPQSPDRELILTAQLLGAFFERCLFQNQTSLIQNANIRTLISNLTYNLVRIKQPLEHINDKIAFTFNNLHHFRIFVKRISNIKSLIDEVRCKQLEIQFNVRNELLVHHILINKDYVDKIEKQLSNSDSQVSSTPPVIQLSQPSSSTLITISEP
ncbi:unnamed protein product [Rotaria sp. Silwood2]|nr:unnamed protein product [Rotaria sp. Silwood2]